MRLPEAVGTVPSQRLSRSATHRLLLRHVLSQIAGSGHLAKEKRSFTAEFAGSIWYGEVMHGPRVPHKGQLRKTYLVSLIDDASRLVAHSAFCLGETALDVEGVLKQAVLRRGVPIKLVVDNRAAYRVNTLQGVCAPLGIHLLFCRPYAPERKEKLERWHRTCRDQFLSELDERRITDLAELNDRLWAWARAGPPPERARQPGRHDVAGALSARSASHCHLVLYQAETDFGRADIYRGLARALRLEPSYRRAQLWRDIKLRVHELVDTKQVTPV